MSSDEDLLALLEEEERKVEAALRKIEKRKKDGTLASSEVEKLIEDARKLAEENSNAHKHAEWIALSKVRGAATRREMQIHAEDARTKEEARLLAEREAETEQRLAWARVSAEKQDGFALKNEAVKLKEKETLAAEYEKTLAAERARLQRVAEEEADYQERKLAEKAAQKAEKKAEFERVKSAEVLRLRSQSVQINEGSSEKAQLKQLIEQEKAAEKERIRERSQSVFIMDQQAAADKAEKRAHEKAEFERVKLVELDRLRAQATSINERPKEPSEKSQLKELMAKEKVAEKERMRERTQSVHVLEQTAAAEKAVKKALEKEEFERMKTAELDRLRSLPSSAPPDVRAHLKKLMEREMVAETRRSGERAQIQAAALRITSTDEVPEYDELEELMERERIAEAQRVRDRAQALQAIERVSNARKAEKKATLARERETELSRIRSEDELQKQMSSFRRRASVEIHETDRVVAEARWHIDTIKRPELLELSRSMSQEANTLVPYDVDETESALTEAYAHLEANPDSYWHKRSAVTEESELRAAIEKLREQVELERLQQQQLSAPTPRNRAASTPKNLSLSTPRARAVTIHSPNHALREEVEQLRASISGTSLRPSTPVKSYGCPSPNHALRVEVEALKAQAQGIQPLASPMTALREEVAALKLQVKQEWA